MWKNIISVCVDCETRAMLSGLKIMGPAANSPCGICGGEQRARWQYGEFIPAPAPISGPTVICTDAITGEQVDLGAYIKSEIEAFFKDK